MRFVTGGTDGLVKYWILNLEQQKFIPTVILTRPEWIRDAAFLHLDSMELFEWGDKQSDILAICSERSGTVILTKTENGWNEFGLPVESSPPAKLTWIVDASNLSVVYEDGTMKIYEETTSGKWEESINS